MAMDTIKHDEAGSLHTVILGCPSNGIASVVRQQAVANRSLRRREITVVAAGELERKEQEKQCEILYKVGSSVRVLSHHDISFYDCREVERAIVVLPESQDTDASEHPLKKVVRKIMILVDQVPYFEEMIAEPIVVENEPKKGGGDLAKTFVVKGPLAEYLVACALDPGMFSFMLQCIGVDEDMLLTPAEVSLSPLKNQASDLPGRLPKESEGTEDSPDQTGDVNQDSPYQTYLNHISESSFVKSWIGETKGTTNFWQDLYLSDPISRSPLWENIEIEDSPDQTGDVSQFFVSSVETRSIMAEAKGTTNFRQVPDPFDPKTRICRTSKDLDASYVYHISVASVEAPIMAKTKGTTNLPRTCFFSWQPMGSRGTEGWPDQTETKGTTNLPSTVSILDHNFSGPPLGSRGTEGWPDQTGHLQALIEAGIKGTSYPPPTVSLLSKSIRSTAKGVLNFTSTKFLRVIWLAIASCSFMSVVEANAPGAAPAQGTLGAGKFEKSSSLVFGVMGTIGVLFTVFGVMVAIIECRRRRATGAALGAPDREALNSAVQILAERRVFIEHHEHVRIRSEEVLSYRNTDSSRFLPALNRFKAYSHLLCGKNSPDVQ